MGRYFNVHRILRRVPMSQGMRLRLDRMLLERAARRSHPDDDSLQWDFDVLEEEERRYHSRQLMRRARALRLSTPVAFPPGSNKLSEDYVRSGVDGRVLYLSLIGEQKVRAAIREEERHRSDARARLIPYLTAISGLIGTITGLAAVLQKWWP